jgi:hypothetical protein
MIMATTNASSSAKDLPNGEGMAAILAAGIGCAALGVFDFLGDAVKRVGEFFSFYNPTGTLSGVTDTAIVVWLAAWYLLARRWGGRDVSVGRVSLRLSRCWSQASCSRSRRSSICCKAGSRLVEGSRG